MIKQPRHSFHYRGPIDGLARAGSLATLRRLYHHVLHGGVLRPEDLERTEGASTPEAISALIAKLEQEHRITEISSEALARAMSWWQQHQEHVARLIASDGPSYPPSGSDTTRPELWKAAHWRWLQGKSHA